MEFESDPAKAAQNLKKHKVSFEEAASVCGDPMAYTFLIQTIRWVKNAGLCLACHVWVECSQLFTPIGAGNIASSMRGLQQRMKGKYMKKSEEMRAEYKREDLGKGVRGKHLAEFKKGSNLVLLTPELSKIFPTNEAVNAALISLIGIARSATNLTSPPSVRATKRRTA